jgi:hypothetical protein
MRWKWSGVGLGWDREKGGGFSDDSITRGLGRKFGTELLLRKIEVKTSHNCLPDTMVSSGMDENKI